MEEWRNTPSVSLIAYIAALLLICGACDVFDPYAAARLPEPPPIICRMDRDRVIQPQNWPVLQDNLYDQASKGASGSPTGNPAAIGVPAGTKKWSSGVLAPNGRIYGIPMESTSVLIIDPETNTADTSTIGGLSGGDWNGGTLGFDGKIYGIPRNSNNVLVIDPKAAGALCDSVILCGYFNKF